MNLVQRIKKLFEPIRFWLYGPKPGQMRFRDVLPKDVSDSFHAVHNELASLHLLAIQARQDPGWKL
jgi:hypothetical protein